MKKLLFIALLLICPQLAHAASQRNPCYTTDTLTTNGVKNCIDVGTNTPMPVTSSGGSATANQGTAAAVTNAWPVANQPYPSGATPITASATGTTGIVSASLAGAAAKTTYLCSVQIGEAGTASTATATATNTISGTLNYVVTAPGNFTVTYTPCVPANAVNTAITVGTAANASANAVAVTITGYQQ